MDYQAFFADVLGWIGEVNQAAARFGMHNSEYWMWVADSTGAICKKYNDHRLAIMQMMMMVEWLEEVYKGQQAKT